MTCLIFFITSQLYVHHGELQLSQLTLQSRATLTVVRKSEGSTPLDTTTATVIQ